MTDQQTPEHHDPFTEPNDSERQLHPAVAAVIESGRATHESTDAMRDRVLALVRTQLRACHEAGCRRGYAHGYRAGLNEGRPLAAADRASRREQVLESGLRAIASRAAAAGDNGTAADAYAVLASDRHLPVLVGDDVDEDQEDSAADTDAEELACAWSDYRKDYEPGEYMGPAKKAFEAGWQARAGQLDAGGVQR